MLCIAKEFAAGKIQNYLAFFQQRFRKEQYLFINELERVIQQMNQAGEVNQVRGLEGAAAKKIYQKLNNFIEDDSFFSSEERPEEPRPHEFPVKYWILPPLLPYQRHGEGGWHESVPGFFAQPAG